MGTSMGAVGVGSLVDRRYHVDICQSGNGLCHVRFILLLYRLGLTFRITTQKQSHESIAATWLLPIVSSVVAAASGGIVANAIMPWDPSLAASTVVVSYIIWGTGVPVACFIITLWIQRTIIGGAPAPGALPSLFLPLGPCGQGSFGMILLGRTVRELAYSHGVGLAIAPLPSSSNATALASLTTIADAIFAGGLVTGLILWGLGLCWYLLAFALISHHVINDPNRSFFLPAKFSVGFWAFTFPIGVFATSTNLLAIELDSAAFRVIGAFLSVQVALHWVYVSVMTVYKLRDGSIFVAPEMAQIEGTPRRRLGKGQGDLEEQ